MKNRYGRVVKPGNFKKSGSPADAPPLSNDVRDTFAAPEAEVTPDPPTHSEPEVYTSNEEVIATVADVVVEPTPEVVKEPVHDEDVLLKQWEAEEKAKEEEVVDPIKPRKPRTPKTDK
jgi:hypothetical protein